MRPIASVVGALLMLGACDRSLESTPEAREDAMGVEAERVTYSLDWIWGEAVPTEGGVGWSVTTDLGYELQVERAWLTTYAVSLVPCPEPVEEDDADPLAMLGEWLVPTAHAGHSGVLDDSAVEDPVVEDLSVPGITTMGTAELSPTRYCRVHLLSAAAPEDARGPALDGDPVGTTLVLIGRMRAPGAERWQELALETSLANGTFLELPDEPSPSGALEITIHRRLDTLLDGIALDGDDAVAMERKALLDLMHGATLDASVEAP